VFVTALKGGTAGGRSDWIRVSEGAHASWSPDSKMVYMLSARDGFQCLWAQRLVPETRQPAGEAFAVKHFHEARQVLPLNTLGFGLASDRFVLPIAETRGNVWLAKLD